MKRKFRTFALAAGAAIWVAVAAPARARDAALHIYFIDVEGGQSTLIVTPSRQSLLVDTGWRGFGGRDAGRIMAVAREAGLKQIDYLLITHFHMDHVGGVPRLAALIPIRHFLDHGGDVETDAQARQLYAAYEEAARKHRRIVKPGDTIPLRGLSVRILASNGEHIKEPLEGAGDANGACADVPPQAPDPSENAQSVGFVLTFGRFRFLDLGDLTWNKELALICPKNVIGAVDVFLVSHHGMNISNSPALVWAIRPRVAILDNSAKKGGSPEAWTVVEKSPGLEDLWQLHYAEAGGPTHNVAEKFIANPGETDHGYALELAAHPDGFFTVLNTRNDFAKDYPPN